MTHDPATIKALAAELAPLLLAGMQAPAAPKPILSTSEAMVVAGYGSESAFYRWTATWGVTNSGAGRWPRHRVQAGLEKEARSSTRLRAKADRKPADDRRAA